MLLAWDAKSNRHWGEVGKTPSVNAWGPSSEPQDPCEKPGVSTHAGNSSSGEAETGGPFGIHQPASLAQLDNPKFRRRPCAP